jgi:hypothetical protein
LFLAVTPLWSDQREKVLRQGGYVLSTRFRYFSDESRNFIVQTPLRVV